MNATKELSEFLRKFEELQWRQFALDVLELQEKDLKPKLKGLLGWYNTKSSRSDALTELYDLRHQFFCGKEMDTAETSVTNEGEEHPVISVTSAAAPSFHNAAAVKDSLGGEIKPTPTKLSSEPDGGDGTSCKRILTSTSSENKPPQAVNDDEAYDLSGRRHVLIINNSFDYKDKKIRKEHGFKSRKPGCDEDVARMQTLWVDKLGCELFDNAVQQDKSAVEMRCIIRRMAEEVESEDCAYLIVIIMSHGGYDGCGEYLQGMGGSATNELYVRDITRPFCEKFGGIPKLFIFHGCRGKIFDSGVASDTTSAGECFSNGVPPKQFNDFIVVYPSSRHHLAFESADREKGSWLIIEIFKIFMRYYPTMNVSDMLTLVNYEMMQRCGNYLTPQDGNTIVKTMSEFVCFLTKDFYLDNVPT